MNNPEEATPPRNEEAVAFKYPLLNIIAATKPAMIVNTHTSVESGRFRAPLQIVIYLSV